MRTTDIMIQRIIVNSNFIKMENNLSTFNLIKHEKEYVFISNETFTQLVTKKNKEFI
jgi:hypothetical protein